jgi:hypothetical protein
VDFKPAPAGSDVQYVADFDIRLTPAQQTRMAAE